MSSELVIPSSWNMLKPIERRDRILLLEQKLTELTTEELEVPIEEYRADGLYGRLMKAPKDSLIVGKIHRHHHMSILLEGSVRVATEEGVMDYHAPCIIISKEMTKRALYGLTDYSWLVLHPTNKTNIEDIEEEMIQTSYNDLQLEKSI